MDPSNTIVFTALSDPTRLTIVDTLATRGALAASEICRMFNSTPSAISQHLKVLREAGLTHVTKRGQHRVYSLDPTKMTEAQHWLQERTNQWNARLDAMESYIEQQKSKEEEKHD